MSKFQNEKTGVVVSVADSKDGRFTAGWKAYDGEAPVSAYPEGAPDVAWKAEQLKAYAADKGVDLGGATKKEDLVAAITAAAETGK